MRGVLADPFAAPRRVERHYADVADLEADARGELRGVVLTADSPLAAALPDLLDARLPVLLADAAPWEPDLLREARAVAGERDVAVAVLLRERHRGWARLVRAATDVRPAPRQVTVRGWPRGPQAAAELVDLVRAWCGDVVAAAAVPTLLPADALPDGPPVAWALLTDRATTVLVAHEGPGPEVRLSFRDGRLAARPDGVGWEGGDGVVPAPGDPAADVAEAFAEALRLGTPEPLGPTLTPWPWVADLAELVPVARVLAALRTSARTEVWAELGPHPTGGAVGPPQ